MEKIRIVLEKYKYCIKLKDLLRTGWETWNVQRWRRESDAEHVYATIMLAEAMYYAFSYDVDIYKVVFMLANHEIGEAKIGDFNPFQISRKEKEISVKFNYKENSDLLRHIDNEEENHLEENDSNDDDEEEEKKN